MGKHYHNRRDFFKTLTGQAGKEDTGEPEQLVAGEERDELFERYSRKELGERHYSTEIVQPPARAERRRGPANRVGNVTTGLTPYAGIWDAWTVSHLLRRTGHGAKYADVTNLLTMSTSAAVDALCTIVNTPATPLAPSATPLNYYNNTATDSSGVVLGADWTGTNLTFATNSNDSTVDYYRQLSLTAWHWGLWLSNDSTIREKMVSFWYHFIPINFDDVRNTVVNSSTICNQYMKLLRDNALGNYKTLIKAVAKSPAMLVFLGGQYSTASAPNENFGRELLELFAMGKLPTQNYTEADVQAAAKVFSGWKVASYTAAWPLVAAFNSSYHNTATKVFSSNFNSTSIANAGSAEFDTFFNMLFQYQGTTIAKYICRRLYRFFVYYDIDANVEANVITPLAAMLYNSSNPSLATNWDILPVVKALLKSEHFYDLANRGVMIKSPIDLLAGSLRNFGINTLATATTNTATPPVTTPQVVNQYAVWMYLHNYTNGNLEQGCGLVPNVSGWKAYYQSPGYYQNWVNTNTIQKRASLMTTLLNGTTQGGVPIKIDSIAYIQQFPPATSADPDALVNAIVKDLLAVDLDTAFKTNLKTQNLLLNQTNPTYWSDAWNAYLADPNNTTKKNVVLTRLKNLLTAILQLAEYQLM